jgi:membrane protein YdbS with pleckstrin-like domain
MRSRVVSRLLETFWVLVLAIVVLFAFFLLLGAFTPSDGVTLTIVVAILAVLWIAHAVWDSRHRDPHDRSITRARERRGF